MSRSPLKITHVSYDRGLLRGLSWLLAQFGYESSATADLSRALMSVRQGQTDLLLVDQPLWDGHRDEVEAAKLAGPGYAYVLLLCDQEKPGDVLAAVEAGVDDFLEKPLNNGEVLARVRAAARFCEFERRCREQIAVDPRSGLCNEASLRDHLERQVRSSSSRHKNLACAAVHLDGFDLLEHDHGMLAGAETQRRVVKRIREASGPGFVSARLADDRLAVMLPDTSLERAHSWAEQLRAGVSEEEFLLGDRRIPLSVSVGVAAATGSEDGADEILLQAIEAMNTARQSGGNLVARSEEFRVQKERLVDLVRNGNPFAGSVARDVMTPLTTCLRLDEACQEAAEKFSRTGHTMLPVVDAQDAFHSLLYSEDIDRAPATQRDRVKVSEISGSACTLPEDASFGEVMQQFTQHDQLTVVIVSGSEPRGYIARESFLALVNPVTCETFAPHAPPNNSSQYLLIPEVAECEFGEE